jgi:hypothetical protein
MREHALIHKPVINLDHGGTRHIMCAWEECEKDGYELNKVVVNEAGDGYPAALVTYVFCTERHKMYWVNSHRSYGMLPPGYRRSYI